MCVQRFDDSLNSAIHITYRISLRSSSMPEPRDPLLKVFNDWFITRTTLKNGFNWASGGGRRRREGTPATRQSNNGKLTRGEEMGASPKETGSFLVMILPQVHLRKPCYDFYFL